MKQTKNDVLPTKNTRIFSEEEKEMLNLIAEMMANIIIKETEDERDRLCADQHERSI